jgi:hypothetical protein
VRFLNKKILFLSLPDIRMPLVLTVILALTMLYISCDSIDVKPDQEANFIKLFGGNGNEEGNDLALLPDGGYLVVGSSTSNTVGGKDVYVVRTDKTGNMVWEARFGGQGDDAANAVILGDDGNIYVCGEKTKVDAPGAGLRDVYVLKLSVDGALLGEQTYGDPLRDEYGTDIFDIPNAGLLITSTWNNSTNSTYYIMETDNNLDILDKRERYLSPSEGVNNLSTRSYQRTDLMPLEPPFVAFGSAQQLLGDNTRVFKFQASYFNTIQDDSPPVLYGFDASNSFCTDVKITTDGGYIMSGYNVSGANTREMVVKVNKGRFLEEGWKQVYTNQFNRNIKNTGIFQTNDGGFIVISTIELDDPLNDEISLLRLNPEGDEMWRKTFGGGADDAGTNVLQLEDGSFVLSCTIGFQINPNSQFKMGLIKVSPEGELVPME